jgi:hypothetical protein
MISLSLAEATAKPDGGAGSVVGFGNEEDVVTKSFKRRESPQLEAGLMRGTA